MNYIQLSSPTKEWVVTQKFGVNPEMYAPLGLPGHNGLDLRAFMKTPLYACCDGVVTRVENGDVNDTTKGRYVYYNSDPFVKDGKTIRLKILYYHIWSCSVKVGDRITRGQEIALADNTGTFTTGSHLHLGVYPIDSDGFNLIDNAYAGAIDPEPLFTNQTDMRLIKMTGDKDIYLVINNTLVNVIDMPTLQAIGNPAYETVNSLDGYTKNGSLIWVDRKID